MKKFFEVIILATIICVLTWGMYIVFSVRHIPKPPRRVAQTPQMTPIPATSLPALKMPAPTPTPTTSEKKCFNKNDAPSIFSGRVLDENGNPVSGVELRLYKNSDFTFRSSTDDKKSSDTKPLLTTRTNSEGDYRFDAVPAGTYRLEICPTNYASYWLKNPLIFHPGISLTEFDLIAKMEYR